MVLLTNNKTLEQSEIISSPSVLHPDEMVQAYDVYAVPGSVSLCLEAFSKAISKSSTHMQWRRVMC